jgi:hypothetical protein
LASAQAIARQNRACNSSEILKIVNEGNWKSTVVGAASREFRERAISPDLILTGLLELFDLFVLLCFKRIVILQRYRKISGATGARVRAIVLSFAALSFPCASCCPAVLLSHDIPPGSVFATKCA